MVTIMETNFENVIAEPEEYGDEVLNASWLPPPAQSAAAEPEPPPRRAPAADASPPLDADSFLQAVYRYQE